MTSAYDRWSGGRLTGGIVGGGSIDGPGMMSGSRGTSIGGTGGWSGSGAMGGMGEMVACSITP
ncbi:MAG: hypothetical protein ABIP90_07285 [Vicinamibacterales bacterium]